MMKTQLITVGIVGTRVRGLMPMLGDLDAALMTVLKGKPVLHGSN